MDLVSNEKNKTEETCATWETRSSKGSAAISLDSLCWTIPSGGNQLPPPGQLSGGPCSKDQPARNGGLSPGKPLNDCSLGHYLDHNLLRGPESEPP